METYFYSYFDLKKWLSEELREKYNENILCSIIDLGLIVSFDQDGETYFFEKDVFLCKKIMEENYHIEEEIKSAFGYRSDLLFDILKIGFGTFIKTSKGEKKKIPAYVRNITFDSMLDYDKIENGIICNLNGNLVASNNLYVIRYFEKVQERSNLIKKSSQRDFANTSTYMGIKRPIMDFVIDSIMPYCDNQTVFVDLMCGSGSVANVFSQFGKTYASDAQLFCRLLAKVQGKGFNTEKASVLLNKIYPDYLRNMEELNRLFGESVSKEANIFHMDMANLKNVFETYIEFINNTKLYSSTNCVSENINALINQRKQNSELCPYCLFTLYFANVYFGVEQSFQIDSIRYAIEQIDDKEDREWLTGVLIITASVIASNYGGHFAQPIKIEEKNIEFILEKRKKSAWLEFSRRLAAIAEESENSDNEISIITGPWERTLEWLEKQLMYNAVVYLDAPYKREDYSRYYHVLETLAKYDYPSSEYKSRSRSIKAGERFRSDFSTRNNKKIETIFVSIITRILNDNFVCAWSYSNNGSADILKIINEVKEKCMCDIFVYATDHKHMKQGKQGNRSVNNKIVEYCIVFKNCK